MQCALPERTPRFRESCLKMLRITNVVVAGLTLAVLLCCVPGSQAAVYGGSATDPSGDLGLFVGDGLPSPLVDFTGVERQVRRRERPRRSELHVQPDPGRYQTINAGVGLGTILAERRIARPRSFTASAGTCSTATPSARRPLADGQTSGGNVWGSVWNFNSDEVTWQTTSLYNWSGSDLDLRHRQRATGRQALQLRARRPLRERRRGRGPVGIDFLNADVFALAPVTPAAADSQMAEPQGRPDRLRHAQ